MKKNNNSAYDKMIKKFNTPDGGFTLDDSLPLVIFADKNDSDERKKEIYETNKKNLDKYIGGK